MSTPQYLETAMSGARLTLPQEIRAELDQPW
jgi:hypothetical protein